MKKILLLSIICILLFAGVADAVSFTMQVKNNSLPAYIALPAGNVVYRGDTIKFTDTTGGPITSWDWSYGDGFSNLNPAADPIVEHRYTFGKHPILMQNGFKLLEVTLTINGAASHSETINFTTGLPKLIIETDNVTLMNENLSQNYTEALTGNRTAPPGWSGFDWVRGIATTEETYTSVLGTTVFLILIFSVPFIMNWIITKDFVVAGIIGGFLGVFIIVRLPANMQLLAVTFIAMSIVAVIYSLVKERI